ncbi:hypothetical protein HUN41_00272 [Streptomyces phage Coruscant]|uniref:Large ribosomal subunit protein bL12 C-terminal domain-containing protein n=1 Tax=Streptomyces phage Coruscant TaxID=2739834 RepID=A0A7G4AVU6_9CAUD|nr:hypothetical protein PP454_gp006 [Streptomyces phage Coruscant]YP_010651595.1 hypothetical protein PP454_gp057 [Streptomyces phage Coruscant]QMP84136.1 hypothetical protein HUN41_00006 [Streptomyces phage Coruscant]QMP84360.1 hypothetical protein HUN41_00272 [Streptomyces phage Coruscant]
MSIFSVSRIMVILDEEGINIKLSDAFRIARKIFEAHSQRVIFVENTAFDRGVESREADVDRSYEKGRTDGYNSGRIDGIALGNDNEYRNGYTNGYAAGNTNGQNEHLHQLTRYQNMEQKMLGFARIEANAIVQKYPNQKIKCIKELRAATYLGLADAKRIIDAAFKSMEPGFTESK